MNQSGFWSSETLTERLPTLISPFAPEHIKYGAYELALGAEAFVSGGSKRFIPEDGEVVIPQGQFALLLTEETIKVPEDAIAFISMKSGNKYRGLINISGFHVDPGWEGKLIFSVFNAGVQELHLSRKRPLFMIWYTNLDAQTKDLYSGEHKGQSRIPDSMITNIAVKHPSPTSLQKDIFDAKQELRSEIEHLRKDVSLYRTVSAGLVSLAVTAAVAAFLRTNALPVQVTVPANPTSAISASLPPTAPTAPVSPSPSSVSATPSSATPSPTPSIPRRGTSR
jgi:dCTP deaminase